MQLETQLLILGKRLRLTLVLGVLLQEPPVLQRISQRL